MLEVFLGKQQLDAIYFLESYHHIEVAMFGTIHIYTNIQSVVVNVSELLPSIKNYYLHLNLNYIRGNTRCI